MEIWFTDEARVGQQGTITRVWNVWEYLRANFLSHCVWDTYEAILDACQSAWNKLMQMPERIASITRRAWAKPVTG